MKRIIGLLGVSLLLVNCSSKTVKFEWLTQKGEPVAKIGPISLSSEGIKSRLSNEANFIKEYYLKDVEHVQKYLNEEVKKEVLAQEGIRLGYLSSDDVQEMIKRALVEEVSKKVVEPKVQATKVSDEEIEAYYKEHFDQFHKPETNRILYIYVPFADDKGKSLKQAKSIYQEALKKNAGDEPKASTRN